VLIAVGVRFYREGLALALGRRRGLEVVAAVADLDELFRQLDVAATDVVLLDLGFDDGLRAVRTISAAYPGTSVVALQVDDVVDGAIAWIEAGATSFVAREASVEEVVTSIEATVAGGAAVSPRLAAIMIERVRQFARAERVAAPALTHREREVAALIEDGLSNKQIASRLSIEVPTVKNHVHNILEKLHVSRRGEAAAELRRSRDGIPAG
jgi:two-component system, NarL family, nitrate/nitrite response regulator NarL